MSETAHCAGLGRPCLQVLRGRRCLRWPLPGRRCAAQPAQPRALPLRRAGGSAEDGHQEAGRRAGAGPRRPGGGERGRLLPGGRTRAVAAGLLMHWVAFQAACHLCLLAFKSTQYRPAARLAPSSSFCTDVAGLLPAPPRPPTRKACFLARLRPAAAARGTGREARCRGGAAAGQGGRRGGAALRGSAGRGTGAGVGAWQGLWC